MPSFTQLFLFFSVVTAINALATPHVARNLHHHRAIAARAPLVDPIAAPAARSVRKRAPKRCKPRPTPTPAPTPVANAAPDPPAINDDTPPKDDKPPKEDPPPSANNNDDDPPPPPPPSPTTKKADPTPPPPPPPPSGNLPKFMTGTQTGQGTFYDTGLGACGITNNDGDFIAAVSHLLFDAFPGYKGGNPNLNPMCGRKVRASYKGKSVVVALTDRCEGCALTDLDFSPSAFDQLASRSEGRISGVTWVWL